MSSRCAKALATKLPGQADGAALENAKAAWRQSNNRWRIWAVQHDMEAPPGGTMTGRG